LPHLWATAKAAERWNAKNPLEAYIDIIRVWGVIVGYKPRTQRPWSRALVRHGEMQARRSQRCSGGAEDIRVREGSG
jgi:hypothetical protein